jgi:PAS domain S-box-containing protein
MDEIFLLSDPGSAPQNSASDKAMSLLRPRARVVRIRSYLLWLILATTVPLMLFAGGAVVLFAQHQRESLKRQMHEIAHTFTVALDLELQTSIAALEGLGSSDYLDSGDLQPFYQQAQRVLRARPTWNTIVLVEPSGHQLINLYRPFGSPLPPRGDMTAHTQALATKRPAVSNIFTGAVTKERVVSVEIPVLRDDVPKYVLVGSIRLEALSNILATLRTSPTWTASIVDGNGKIVARSADAEKYVGNSAGSIHSLVGSSETDGRVAASADGSSPSYAAFNRSAVSPWYVIVSAPAEAFDAPLRRSVLFVAVVAIGITTTGLLLAVLLGRRIAHPVSQLATVAAALEREQAVPVVVTPIDEVNRAAAAIRNSAGLLLQRQESLRVVVESMSAPVTRCSRDLRYLWVSKPYADWLGRPIEDIVGRPIVDVIGAPAIEAIRPHIECVLAGERVEYEERVMFRGLGARWIHAVYTPTLDAAGTPDGWVAVVLDVDERRRLEDDRGRLAAIVESSDDAIISKTVDGIITSWNPGAEHMFGWTAEEAVGQHITLIIPEDRRAEEDQVLAKIRRGERVKHFETVRVTKDFRLLNISLTVSPVKDAAGRIIGASKVARDISERRRLEDERDRLLVRERIARQDAEASARTKDQLLATVSHELRTPLNSLLGYARMIQQNQLDEAAQRHAIDVIVRNATTQAQLVDDLLDLSRVVTGRMRLTFENCHLTALVDEALDSVRPAAEAKGVVLRSALEPDVGPVRAAPERIRQIIWNLAMNAIKFTPGGGHINVFLTRAGNHAQLVVADTGVGISREILPFIFEPFRQEDSSSTRAHSGLGLGLALVKTLVELHGGEVRAESGGKGKGACFSVTIPLIPAATAM